MSRWACVAAGAAIAALASSGSGIRLVDQSAGSGLIAHVRNGSPERRWIPEANGTGVAVLDFDDDGWMDLLVASGGDTAELARIAVGETPRASRRLFLYRNTGKRSDGAIRFEDVTARSGLANPYWPTGVNAVDFDGDGDTDVLVTNLGVDLLFRNNGGGKFTEIGRVAGLLQSPRWHTGSTFGDYDGDGDLDLYIAGYVDLKALPWTGTPPVCDYRGMPAFCGPLDLKGEADVLYRNNGGIFADVTSAAGAEDRAGRFGFSALFEDLTGDGKPDLFVTNDSGPNYFYRNVGGGKFEESALTAGVGFNADGRTQANMGIAAGDFDNDGDTDLFVTTFSEDHFPLFEQISPGFFEDVSSRLGLAAPTTALLGWATGFADFDNDGDRDLWTANGHVYPTADKLGSTTYRQPVAVFENTADRFRRALVELRTDSYRGGASADFDNDGRIDLVVIPVEGAPLLVSNSAPAAAWLGLRLEGGGKNRDALGARVTVSACGKRQVETVRNGGGYLSRNDPRLHFGLGACSKVDELVVEWPGGKRQVITGAATGRYVRVQLH